MKSLALFLLKLYQKFFTLIGYGSCRYYPTCSQYTKEQLLHNGLIKALFYSLIRILKCNQLFPGGIDYPVMRKRLSSSVSLTSKHTSIRIHFWFIPKNEESFYVVKAFKPFDIKGNLC